MASDSVTQWTAAHEASLSITISWSLLQLMSIELVMLSNHLILCPILSSCPINLVKINFKKEIILTLSDVIYQFT